MGLAPSYDAVEEKALRRPPFNVQYLQGLRKWRARYKRGHEVIVLGHFDTENEAEAALVSARCSEIKAHDLNRENVRTCMEDFLGCTPKEISFMTGVSLDQARRAVRNIRAEWTPRMQRRVK
jgi:hypothetical protein